MKVGLFWLNLFFNVKSYTSPHIICWFHTQFCLIDPLFFKLYSRFRAKPYRLWFHANLLKRPSEKRRLWLWPILARVKTLRTKRLYPSTETLKHFQSKPRNSRLNLLILHVSFVPSRPHMCKLLARPWVTKSYLIPWATSLAKWTEPGFTRNGLTGQSPVDQLTSGHISPFNESQRGVGMRGCSSYKNSRGWSLRQEWLNLLKSNQPYMVGYDFWSSMCAVSF